MKKFSLIDRYYLAPRYIGEGFIVFFTNLHRILLFTLFFILTSVPLITFGASAIAFNAVLRKIADDDKVTVKEYFAVFSKKILCGIPYSVIFCLVVFLLSIPVSAEPMYYVVEFCAVLLFCLTVWYPVAAYSISNVPKLLGYSVIYAFAHLLQLLMLVSLALIFLFIIAYTSEFLLLLFFPVFYYILNRIVLANNAEAEERERSNQNDEVSAEKSGTQINQ